MSKGWRYRVVKDYFTWDAPGELGRKHKDARYSIREFYPADEEVMLGDMWTLEPMPAIAFDSDGEAPIASLRTQLKRMLQALDEPILEDIEQKDE